MNDENILEEATLSYQHYYKCGIQNEKDYIGGFINGYKSALEQSPWVSVETPPRESGRYWCYVEEVNDLGISHFQWNCAYSANENRWSDDGRITHWQPLSSPPKTETDGK